MRLLVLLLMTTWLLGATATTVTSTVKLNDLPAVAAQQSAIHRIVSQGIIAPATATTFNPNGTVTRSDFSAMLQKLFALSPTVVAIYMNPQVFCFGCALQSNVSSKMIVTRGQATVYILRILAAQGKVTALAPATIQSTINSTSDAKTWDPRLAPLYALGVHEQIAPLYGSAGLGPNTAMTRVHAALLLDNTQRLKSIPIRQPLRSL